MPLLCKYGSMRDDIRRQQGVMAWGGDLQAQACRFYNDKYEINIVTLICPKHNCDVVHRVSIKRGIKTMVVARQEGREAVPF